MASKRTKTKALSFIEILRATEGRTLRITPSFEVLIWYSTSQCVGKRLFYVNIPFIGGYINFNFYFNDQLIAQAHIAI